MCREVIARSVHLSMQIVTFGPIQPVHLSEGVGSMRTIKQLGAFDVIVIGLMGSIKAAI